MDNDGDEVVEAVEVWGVGGAGVEEAQLEGKHDSVGELGVLVEHVAVFEPLQVQRQYLRKLLDAHSVVI